MISDISLIVVVGLIGVLFILVRFWRSIYSLLTKRLPPKLKNKLLQRWAPTSAAGSPFFDRIMEYFITLTVTFVSFYSGYVLSIKKANDDEKKSALELLKQAESRCESLEGLLQGYTKISNEPTQTGKLSDSEVVTNYFNNSIVQPFYMTEAITPERMLKYLSPRSLEVLTGLEEGEKVAHYHVVDTSLSFLQRHISFIAFMKFEYLRDSLIRSERLYIQDSISLGELDSIQDHINRKGVGASYAVDPFLTQHVILDTTGNKASSDFDESETEIESDPEIDSLWRYCYLMIGILNGKPQFSTNGFFLKEKRHLFLVTTYQAMTAWAVWDTSHQDKQQKPFVDTINLRIYSKVNHKCVFFPIDIAKIKRESKKIHAYSEPDVYFFKIPDTNFEAQYEINTINSFLAVDRSKYRIPDRLIVVGSPNLAFTNSREQAEAKAELNFSEIMGSYNIKLYYPGVQAADPVNYKINLSLDDSYWGAPVFFKELVPDVEKFREVLIFGGIYTGHDVNNVAGMAVRPEKIIEEIAKLK